MNILDTVLQPRYTVAELNEAVQRAVLAERQACAADVCPHCAAGGELIYDPALRDGGHVYQEKGHVYRDNFIGCPAAPIHARGQAQKESEAA